MINFGDDQYLTRDEASQLVKKNNRTLDRYAQAGIIERFYQEDRIMYKRSEILLLKSELEKVRSEKLELPMLKQIMDDHKK